MTVSASGSRNKIGPKFCLFVDLTDGTSYMETNGGAPDKSDCVLTQRADMLIASSDTSDDDQQ